MIKHPLAANYTLFELIEKPATLSISIFALIISICSFNSANKQFKINNEESGKTFKIQNEINNNLLNELKKISETTEKQLIDQVNAASPLVKLGQITISDIDKISNNSFKPVIKIPFVNIGKRIATNFILRTFIVTKSNDTFNINIPLLPFENRIIGPDDRLFNMLKPDLPASGKDDFYIVIDLKYFDSYTNKWIYKSEFQHYTISRSNHMFLFCNQNEITFLSNIINKKINNHNTTSDIKLEYVNPDMIDSK